MRRLPVILFALCVLVAFGVSPARAGEPLKVGDRTPGGGTVDRIEYRDEAGRLIRVEGQPSGPAAGVPVSCPCYDRRPNGHYGDCRCVPPAGGGVGGCGSSVCPFNGSRPTPSVRPPVVSYPPPYYVVPSCANGQCRGSR